MATKIFVISGNIVYTITPAWARYAVRVGREQGKVEQDQTWGRLRASALVEFDNAIVIIDDDFDYGEERLKAIGVIHGGIYVLVYTEVEDIVRVISLRRANKTEARGYVESC